MKLVIAVIQPHRLDAVRAALLEIGIEGMTVVEARGYGRQKGHHEIYRGAEYDIAFVPKLRLEIAVNEERLDATLTAIRKGALTGKIGDGKMFVIDLKSVVRVRTGETDVDAL
jgi:nitrogen regulatory protein P-II 2